jgi:hypothetical protein
MSKLSPPSEYNNNNNNNNNNNKDNCSLVFQKIDIDQTTRCHDPEENNIVIHRSENLKAYNQL